MKFIYLLNFILSLSIYANINSGGGDSIVGQLSNSSSIGGFTSTTASSAGNVTLRSGLINIIFIPSLSNEETDSDNDGIPDNWEITHGLSIGQDNSNSDSDGDGFLDVSEFISGTNPNDQNSFLDILISEENGAYNLSFNSTEGRTYTLEVSKDLNVYYIYHQVNGNGSSINIPFNPSDESNTSILGSDNFKDIFFRLLVEID